MIRSMTGYGDAERESPAGRVRAEIKTVNHRFFSVNVRLPPALDRYEVRVRDWLRAHIARGHVNCFIRVEPADGTAEGALRLKLDEARARGYVEVLRDLKERLDLPGQVDVALLAQLGGLIVPADADEGAGAVPVGDLQEVVEAAAAATARMRQEEGLRLAADLEERLDGIEAALDVIAQRAPERLVAERDRLGAAVAELAGDVAVDEERLAREIAYLAERWDVSEELVRLRSHIELFRDTLTGGQVGAPTGSDGPARAEAAGGRSSHALTRSVAEPVGKRLGFLKIGRAHV